MEDFVRAHVKKTYDRILDAKRIAEATLQEDRLEQRYFDLAEDAYVARQDTQAMQKQYGGYLELVKKARAELTQASRNAKTALQGYNGAKAAHRQAVRAEKRRKKPIAIFISRKKGKLYIRQGYKPIFEAPVTIASPDKPIGTHVFTALRFTEDRKDLVWSVISFDAAVRDRTSKAGEKRRRKRRKRRNISYHTIKPGEALDRITISEAARFQIAQLIKPGSSLIISDKRASNETGEYTDFIVSLNR